MSPRTSSQWSRSPKPDHQHVAFPADRDGGGRCTACTRAATTAYRFTRARIPARAGLGNTVRLTLLTAGENAPVENRAPTATRTAACPSSLANSAPYSKHPMLEERPLPLQVHASRPATAPEAPPSAASSIPPAADRRRTEPLASSALSGGSRQHRRCSPLLAGRYSVAQFLGWSAGSGL
jgi:hypothetical protein